MSRQVLFHKLRAASASFAVFLFFALLLTAVAYRYWYPDFLFWLDGGIQGLRLVYAVGFVLGPVLALVFFHPEKSRGKLIFDIVFVGIIQVSAMAWGAYQIYKERPIAVVYGGGRFISVTTNIMSLQRVTPADMKKYSAHPLPLVYRREPLGPEEIRRQIVLLFKYGIHKEAQAWFFQPFAPNQHKIFMGTENVARFLERDAALRQHWQKSRAALPAGEVKLAFYEGRFANGVLIFDSQGKYLSYVDLGERVLPDTQDAPLVNKAH